MNPESQNKRELRAIDITQINPASFKLIGLWMILFLLPFAFLWTEHLGLNYMKAQLNELTFWSPFKLILIGIVGIIAHELIHGVFFAYYTPQGFRSIKFGVIWKYAAAYCHCSEPLLVRQFIAGVAAPGIILGVTPSVLALFTGSLSVLAFGFFFSISAVGDWLIIQLLLKEDKNSKVLDHPSELGFYIYES